MFHQQDTDWQGEGVWSARISHTQCFIKVGKVRGVVSQDKPHLVPHGEGVWSARICHTLCPVVRGCGQLGGGTLGGTKMLMGKAECLTRPHINDVGVECVMVNLRSQPPTSTMYCPAHRCLTEVGGRGRHAHLQRCRLSGTGQKLRETSAREGAGLEAGGEEAEFREVSQEKRRGGGGGVLTKKRWSLNRGTVCPRLSEPLWPSSKMTLFR